MNNVLGDLLLIILIATFAPIILGVSIGVLIGASGLLYFNIVCITCIICWGIILLWWSI